MPDRVAAFPKGDPFHPGTSRDAPSSSDYGVLCEVMAVRPGEEICLLRRLNEEGSLAGVAPARCSAPPSGPALVSGSFLTSAPRFQPTSTDGADFYARHALCARHLSLGPNFADRPR